MKFTYIPIIDMMIEFYQKPRDPQVRFFDGYLKMIQTPDKKDLLRPLPFFNPMGKEHVLEKLQDMKEMGFEKLMTDVCNELSTPGQELQVYFNLADDIAGGRTDKEQTYEKSLQIRPFISRGFCVVVFFVSDEINAQLIHERVAFYTNLYNTYQN